jgi:hypothetical protein
MPDRSVPTRRVPTLHGASMVAVCCVRILRLAHCRVLLAADDRAKKPLPASLSRSVHCSTDSTGRVKRNGWSC